MKKRLMTVVAVVLSAILMLGITSCGPKNTAVTYADIALSDELYGYCVKPDDTDLLKSVNDLIAEIKENGKLTEFYNAEMDKTAGDIGTVKTKSENRSEELVVATNADFAPWEYFKGSNFAGIDMQIAKLLAEKLNKTLVVVHMDFDAVILSVGNGQCDIGMAGLTISEKRSENVVFSDAYYDASQCIAYKEGDERFTSCKTAKDVVTVLKGLTQAKGGAAIGQTGEKYLKGDDDFSFEGFPNIKVNSYDSIALAVRDLSNGNVDFVVGDRDTIKFVVAGING